MNSYYMKKATGLGALSITLLVITGCMGTQHLSKNITDEGKVHKADIVFLDMNKAWQPDGMFPNSENLAKIKPGVDKDELYKLIGIPHFHEGFYAREWDYMMKFHTPSTPGRPVTICQYKETFEKIYKGQEFYWKPDNSTVCPPINQSESLEVIKEFTLDADALFQFAHWETESMLPEGKRKLDVLAQKLIEYQQNGDIRVIITGHADRIGSEDDNMILSKDRANTVRSYLIG